jgi:hypothetical protein
MRKIIDIPIEDIEPNRNAVLENQRIPPNKKLSKKIETLLKKATDLFLEFAHPKGLISAISLSEFEVVYSGENLNEKETPVDSIFRKADDLGLFAFTIGDNASRKIDKLFTTHEFALGCMLDSVASAGTDKAGDIIENHFLNLLSNKGEISHSRAILRYSPGYCGWHISGQKKLFEYLHPEDIGITLLDSYLMKPLKSISGVVVAGKREIHNFEDSYPFCQQCKTHSCRNRIRSLFPEDIPTNKKRQA